MIGFALLLLILGVVLLVVEAFIPGFGVFGISGIICSVVSAIIIAVTIPYGIFIVLAEAAAIVIIMYFLVKYLKKRQLYGKLILDETLDSTKSEIGDLDYFQGKEGIAKTPLRPFGTADFNGSVVEVYSDGSFIKENRRIKVIEVSNKKIIVTELKN